MERHQSALYRSGAWQGLGVSDRLAVLVSARGAHTMMTTAGWAGATVVAAALMLGPGCASAAPPVPIGDYTIGPEDVLDITVWNNTGISRTVPVRPDGKISLPLLDDVQAAGLSPRQLKDTLTKRLAKYIASPEVSVIVREIHSFRVAVIGEVKTPGRYELKSRASVLDAIALAGGFS